MQCSLAVNAGMLATPDNDSDDSDEVAFLAETWGVEDEDALDWAGFDGRLVKEGEGGHHHTLGGRPSR
jgi:hypothetical protein